MMGLRVRRAARCILALFCGVYTLIVVSDVEVVRSGVICSLADVGSKSENESKAAHVYCRPGVPCQYPEEVDFRIIVMTYRRPASLLLLLESLDRLEMDGDTAILEIWIDRDKVTDAADCETLEVAALFNWTRGVRRVHVHQQHVGIYGQWIDTWRPRTDGNELALLLEDDMTVSPYVYRWIKAAHRQYGSRTDVAGYTLQSEEVSKATGTGINHKLTGPEGDSTYLFKRIGTWGFAPNPQHWVAFQDWYHLASLDDTFRPYVPNAPIITKWYKEQEKQGRQDHMWSMWHVYYTDTNNIFTLYNNLEMSVTEENILLAENRRESGLHFSGAWFPSFRSSKILEKWSEQYTKFPNNPVMFDWNGTRL